MNINSQYMETLFNLWSACDGMKFGEFITKLNAAYSLKFGSVYFVDDTVLFERYEQIVNDWLDV